MKVKKHIFGNFSILTSLSPSKTYFIACYTGQIKKIIIAYGRTMEITAKAIATGVHQCIFEHIAQTLKM